MRNRLKALARHLPRSVQTSLKKLYYPWLLRRIDESVEPDLGALKRFVKSGDCVVDVGAGIGVYTRYLSDLVGPRGQVLSFEPLPETFDILRSNVRRLRLHQVRAEPYAISNGRACVALEVPLGPDGWENFYRARVVDQNTAKTVGRRIVEARDLDSYLNEIKGQLSFVKIDVEGHELSVVRGAQKMIERFLPVVLIEISTDPDSLNTAGASVFRTLHEKGYRAFQYAEGSLRPRRCGDASVNYFFLQDKHVL